MNRSIHIPFSVYSANAVSAARQYVTLIEAQMSQAYSDERSEALEQYRNLPNRDREDYETVRQVERNYEDVFRPILRFTSVVYLYMVFEAHVSQHVVEIQRMLGDDLGIFKNLKKKKQCGCVEAAKIYFQDHAKLVFFTDEQWNQLREIAHVRHCIVHNAAIPHDSDSKCSDSIYALETLEWQGQPVGLQIDRYQGRDTGSPMILQRRFLEYSLSILEQFFHSLGAAVDAKFHKENRK